MLVSDKTDIKLKNKIYSRQWRILIFIYILLKVSIQKTYNNYTHLHRTDHQNIWSKNWQNLRGKYTFLQ